MENSIDCKVVMLPQEGNLIFPCVCIGTKELGLRYASAKFGYQSTEYFHLYLISDREIREDDLCLFHTHGILHKGGRIGEGWAILKATKLILLAPPEDRKRVEATTDPTINLPLIPQSFIDEYIQKEGKIDKVRIGMTTRKSMINGKFYEYHDIFDPKLHRKEVIILPMKDSWNREELIEAFLAGQQSSLSFDEWFDKNH